jgi:hypothetical protein
MPVGDCQRSFSEAAAAAGIELVTGVRVRWLNQRGHFGLPPEAEGARAVLGEIFAALGGHPTIQASKSWRPLTGDFLHEPTGTLIEVDEHQHFTTHRLLTLHRYPAGTRLGFDLEGYKALCSEWAGKADRYRSNKPAVGFAAPGRQRQRAYYDALRDLAAPAMGRPPTVRVPAPDRDGTAAFKRVASMLVSLSA